MEGREFEADGIRFQPGNTFKSARALANKRILLDRRVCKGQGRTIDQVETDNHTFEQADHPLSMGRVLFELFAYSILITTCEWLLDNTDEFRKRMNTAFIERRQRNSPRLPLLAFIICYFISTSFCIVCVM